jgi:hypothetical protein
VVCYVILAWSLGGPDITDTLQGCRLSHHGLSHQHSIIAESPHWLSGFLGIALLQTDEKMLPPNSSQTVKWVFITARMCFNMVLPSNGCLYDTFVIPRFLSFWILGIMPHYPVSGQ